MLAVLVGNADWQFDKDDSDKKVLHVVSFGVTRFIFDRYLMKTLTFLYFIVLFWYLIKVCNKTFYIFIHS